MKIIREAEKREYMTKTERLLKKKLIALLRDDGKGHKHAKFAERLADFDIKIVTLEADPTMTAAISFDEGVIYISEGFLSDPATFFQLNVLMRHEMAHNLMMHQIRMVHKYEQQFGDKASRISTSRSLHELINIIEDFEISNKRYTQEDKQIVRNMWLNGQIIGGLVTEDLRKDWMNMPLEDMYMELLKEIDKITKHIKDTWSWNKGNLEYSSFGGDGLSKIISNTYSYSNINAKTNYLHSLKKFVNNRGLYHFVPYDMPNKPCIVKLSSLPEDYQTIIKNIYDNFKDYTKDEVREILKEIAQTGLVTEYVIKHKNSNVAVSIISPEEKILATDTLKALLPELELYKTWYEKVKRVMADDKYSADDLNKVLAALEK